MVTGGGDDLNPTPPSNGHNKGGDGEDSSGDNNHDNGNNPHGGATTDVKTASLATDGKKSPQDASQPNPQDNPSQQDFDKSAKAYREMMAQA